MTWVDGIMATVAVCGLIAFIGIVGWLVGEPDLIIVFVIGGVLAVLDFWRSFRRRNGRRAG
jgi:Flp pilus assembly protein TadB